jgi:hypothetical protein
MSFLDLFEKDQSIASRFQPNEGTRLPSYYELHRQEILIGSTILFAGVLLIAAFHYRFHLRSVLIIILAGALRLNRKTVAKARLFWGEVEDRAD